MQLSDAMLDQIESIVDVSDYKLGLNEFVGQIRDFQPSVPFDGKLIDFCQALSHNIFADRAAITQWPDLAAFASWIRKKNINRIQSRLESAAKEASSMIVPRGVSVHIAPSNVEILFAYSWVLSMLSGCRSIVRVSSSRTQLTGYLVRKIYDVSTAMSIDLNSLFISYERSEHLVNKFLVSKGDVLVIWGGDETVATFRTFPARPDSIMLTFPDRESLMVMHSERYLALSGDERQKIAELSARDVSLFGQQACSSPRSIVWVGREQAAKASLDLYNRWSRISQLRLSASEKFERNSFVHLMASQIDVQLVQNVGSFMICSIGDAFDTRPRHPGHGVLLEFQLDEFCDIEAVLGEADQTVAYFGFAKEEIMAGLKNLKRRWPRRLVPIGSTADFDSIWDGIDLPLAFVRFVSIR